MKYFFPVCRFLIMHASLLWFLILNFFSLQRTCCENLIFLLQESNLYYIYFNWFTGACWSRYYRLETSYYMSSLAMNTLNILKNNFLWQNTFTSTPMLEPGQKAISKIVFFKHTFFLCPFSSNCILYAAFYFFLS